ncbi:MAG: ribonuclease D [Acidimicrobiaceae bacterium]|nr:ribonuclease D [Acidimicrobiaceae bacterium]MXW75617.1 ribonuclease D [Acidimicrobiaceae bacterium]MYC42585.1 ribonuclease D [Acidimicrobiaceae bacterium]MYD05801.1 ribonuclease D [Acidimicrobiaceae bacterium]MYH88361.1 ribonuclease D [Acidimicrobiaceae bacterium]
MPDYRIIDRDDDLYATVDILCQQDRYALDTEFHREQSYWPRVALVQIAWGDQIVLIDPLAIDLKPLKTLMDSDALAVIHAATQDLEVLEQACGAIPKRLFDTQIAAGFLGHSTPSLAFLHERELGVQLAKGSRFTDWLERPLGTSQLDYAASDVARLLEIHDRLASKLNARERISWAEAEFEIMRCRDRAPRDPDEAWSRIKEARHLKGRTLAVVRAIAAWRERRAAELNQPVRFVLSDLAVASIAQAMPTSQKALSKIRGIDRGMVNGQQGIEVLKTVKEGLDSGWRPPRSPKRNTDTRDYRPAVTLATAWIAQVARDNELDPALLATRADVEAFLRGDDDPRLAQGWRARLVGDHIRSLVDGNASLAFDNDVVVLEKRSSLPIT